MKWVVLKFTEDNLISHVLKGEKVQLKDGGNAQDCEAKENDECYAPWQGKTYPGIIHVISCKYCQHFMWKKRFFFYY